MSRFHRDRDIDAFDATKDITAATSKISPVKKQVGKNEGQNEEALASLRRRMAGPSSAKAGLATDQDEINRKGALLLSMSDIPMGPLPKTTLSERGELPLVPLIDMHAGNSFLDDGHPWAGDCIVDPASARVVILWVDDSAIAHVELIEVE